MSEGTSSKNYVEYLRGLSEHDQAKAIDAKIAGIYDQLITAREVQSVMVETNATDWACDEYEVDEIEFGEDHCRVSISFGASGEQDEDSFFAGRSLSGSAIAMIDARGAVEFREVEASIDEEWMEPVEEFEAGYFPW